MQGCTACQLGLSLGPSSTCLLSQAPWGGPDLQHAVARIKSLLLTPKYLPRNDHEVPQVIGFAVGLIVNSDHVGHFEVVLQQHVPLNPWFMLEMVDQWKGQVSSAIDWVCGAHGSPLLLL